MECCECIVRVKEGCLHIKREIERGKEGILENSLHVREEKNEGTQGEVRMWKILKFSFDVYMKWGMGIRSGEAGGIRLG